MEQKDWTELSDEELLQEQKKAKSKNIINGFLIGFLIGVAVYSTVKNGIGFFTFFPLFFAYLAFSHIKKDKTLEKELKSRNLK
ncbi:hypothetical protein HNP38_003170 [Chryseobacterium defluvii]|uniref:FUSC family protein n=1 Tax=Chryseobacterium defluvii TaxID=160396 RepID=A0A840KJK6_9FLAO|nr:hypothetical protein [Chryseobacterium defluvii]MBB4807854.1 hypothetical protein [Chryseobacterium defluvii]